MTESSSQSARRQFGRQAAYYVQSQVHATGDTLQALVDLAQPRPTDRVLDVATGVGFTAFAFAPHVALTIAYDLTHEMLREAISLARQRGLSNLSFVQGPAERLPFPDNSFDIHMCRTAQHHFQSVPDYLAEARRVVRPGGQVLLADTITTEDHEVDRWQNHVELLRDPSHVRDYSPSEWLRFIAEARLAVQQTANHHRTHLSFYDWVERSGTSPETVQELLRLFGSAPTKVAQALEILPKGNDFEFSWPVLVARAVKE